MNNYGTKRRNTGSRRRQIVEAAQKLIVKYGSEHITVKRIAREIGITEGAIYRHFKNKKDILMFMADNVEENLIGDIESACKAPHGDSLAVLHDILKRHLSLISQRKGVSFLVVAEVISYGDKKLNRRVLDVIGSYITRIERILDRAAEAGETRPDLNIRETATMFFSILQGAVHIWALGDFKSDLEVQVEPLWTLFKHSIQAS